MISSNGRYIQPSSTIDHHVNHHHHHDQPFNPPLIKKKRNLPGNPDPEAEVISLSPKTLMATNRFICEICGKGFQRDQNLQLHRRGHNLPWKLKQRTNKEIKKRVYVCPEKSCVHHDPTRALGDLTGIKKHFCRKHGEKKWKCEKCSKKYAVQSDWKAHSKTCGTREYRCDCGTVFSRRDSFVTHRAFCDALAEETARLNAASHLKSLAAAAVISAASAASGNNLHYQYLMGTLIQQPSFPFGATQHNHNRPHHLSFSNAFDHQNAIKPESPLSLWMGNQHNNHQLIIEDHNEPPQPQTQTEDNFNWIFGNAENGGEVLLPSSNANVNAIATSISVPSIFSNVDQIQTANAVSTVGDMSATALLQKAAQMSSTTTTTTTTIDPSAFLNSFAFKISDQNIISEVGEDDSDKLFALFGSNSGLHEIGNPRNGVLSFSDIRELQNYPLKRRRVESNEGGQTRDFLGVGVQTMCRSSSINGWI